MNNIKKFLLPFLFIPMVIFATDKKKSDSLIFKGAFFEASYPNGFTAKPSLPASSAGEYDSVFFISPDKNVKFYVFSPQWSGDANDISMDANLEIEKDKKTEVKNGMKYKWYTYESKDGTWIRSYQETLNAEETTKLIVGIEYASRESYKKYKDEYLKFKKSIRQFAD